MTNESTQFEPAHSETRHLAALIDKCSLSAEQIERILRCAKDHSLGFGNAAMRLGMITSQELQAMAATPRAAEHRDNMTPIETALRKMSSSRQHMGTSTLLSHKVRPTSKLTLVHDPYNVRSEKIRVLRTELSLMVGAANQGCVFALLSPHPGEGRSQLAAELAVAFAQLDRRTLLVDADLRQPRQHTLFEGADDRSGLAHALSSGNMPDLHEVEGVPQLHLLVAGERPRNPLELLSTDYFKRLIGYWRRQYNFVVIDTPPLSQFADGLAAVTVAGNGLLISRAHHTDYKSTKEMLRRLAATQSQILGAVLQYF